MRIYRTGSDFSGVGAFDQALEYLSIKQEKIFACDMDKYARETYVLNYGEPAYYPKDVYDREIPKEPLDIYMTSPPCQGFSLAGQRGGSILFLNSHEFIKINKPRYFIFENVKGLLSHDKRDKQNEYGYTFNQWLAYLGGKSVNGNPIIFPHEESVPYHIYHAVLNAKDYGVPQNRERVFIIGIRDDADNEFSFPKPIHLTIRLKDVLERNVDKRYNLSIKYIDSLIKHSTEQKKKGNGFKFSPTYGLKIANAITTKAGQRTTDNYVFIKSNTENGYEILNDGDSLNYTFPESKTRRGRVGKEVGQTIDTACNQGVFIDKRIRRLTPRECFRLMGFPDTFKWVCSDTQAYKQAGNSIVKDVLAAILKQLL